MPTQRWRRSRRRRTSFARTATCSLRTTSRPCSGRSARTRRRRRASGGSRLGCAFPTAIRMTESRARTPRGLLAPSASPLATALARTSFRVGRAPVSSIM
jgi:hypothetical protein